ncbi:MAG TPA: transporter substrate-binding domain-containing protein [Bacteroidales bacterium]|nr:transporter substrate-binding domain-containing protein [Bacteroidales bacterium]
MKRYVFILILLAPNFLPQSFSYGSPRLKVGVVNIPPFIMTDGKTFSGISIDLWRNLSDSLNLDYEYDYYRSFPELTKAIETGQVDFSICPMSVTSERLQDYRFTIPFYISRLGVAGRISYGSDFVKLVRIIFSWTTVRWILLLLPLTLLFSLLVWAAERKKNKENFRAGIHGIGDALWWAFVTMSTVGYGDKAPKTTLGRILTVIWMFVAIGIFVSVTSVLASRLTVNSMRSYGATTEDLKKSAVGTIATSGYSRFLDQSRISFHPYERLERGLQDVSTGKLDYFVYDETILKYVLQETGLDSKVSVQPGAITLQYFCFPAPLSRQKLIDRINPVLINIIESNQLYSILRNYQLEP